MSSICIKKISITELDVDAVVNVADSGLYVGEVFVVLFSAERG